MILTRAQALKSSRRQYASVRIPEFDEGELRLVSPSAGASIDLSELQTSKGEASREMMVMLIEVSVVDEAGKPLFDAATAAEFLDQISPASFKLIMEAIPKPAGPVTPLGNSKASPVEG